jgi:Mg2+ and Co2+ transporter CorA
MKTLVVFLIFLFVFGYVAFSQKPITINESKIDLKHGTIPGFMLTIPEVSYETVNESWIKSLEKGTKSKVQNDMGEFSIFGAIIKEIAPTPINVYGYVKDKDSVTVLTAVFELKKDEYVTSETQSEKYVKAKEYLFLFAKDLYLNLAKDELKEEEKKLNKMENDLSSLENDKNKLEKMIQSNNASIGSINDELVILRTNLSSLNSELLIQTNQLNTMEEGVAKEEKKKYIDDLDKRIKKTNKEIESNEKKIVDLRSEIEKAQVDSIPENLKEQQRVKTDINQQKEVVRLRTEKFNTIKESNL